MEGTCEIHLRVNRGSGYMDVKCMTNQVKKLKETSSWSLLAPINKNKPALYD